MMERKIIAAILMISSIFVMAAGGQNNSDRDPAEVVLQDDATGDYLFINLTTGDYKFNACQSDIAIGGKAKVSYSGCNITAKDVSETRMVLAEADLCNAVGKAYITLQTAPPSPPAREFRITDSNLRDSQAACIDSQ